MSKPRTMQEVLDEIYSRFTGPHSAEDVAKALEAEMKRSPELYIAELKKRGLWDDAPATDSDSHH